MYCFLLKPGSVPYIYISIWKTLQTLHKTLHSLCILLIFRTLHCVGFEAKILHKPCTEPYMGTKSQRVKETKSQRDKETKRGEWERGEWERGRESEIWGRQSKIWGREIKIWGREIKIWGRQIKTRGRLGKTRGRLGKTRGRLRKTRSAPS